MRHTERELPVVAEGDKRVIIKITGVLVNLLVNLSPKFMVPMSLATSTEK